MNQVARVHAVEDRLDKNRAGEISVTDVGVSLQSMAEAMEYAKLMSVSQQAVPQHLRGQPGVCLAIVDQALRWRLDRSQQILRRQ
ncbi:hypothetical protein [Acuticoccus kandeliae]|uniref:hypothetical protein n=1 Tax=Acuticoccus kandeliae TaxID=2073160 RepID=UPI000D3E9FAA|nr:hypothetical protein [Acuticoccus kandeliae]